MKLSIIIPTFNSEKYLWKCLDAIVGQSFKDLEVIIVDGGSNDGTYGILRDYQPFFVRDRFHILSNPYRIAEKAKLIGLKHARGEYVMFLDSDNILPEPNTLSEDIFGDKHGFSSFTSSGAQNTFIGCRPFYIPCGTSFNTYLTFCLQISDPVSWIISNEASLSALDGENFSTPLGANGTVYLKSKLDELNLEEFEDTEVALKLWKKNPNGCWACFCIEHYICENIWQFIQKRRRQAFHRLCRGETDSEFDWTKQETSRPIWFAVLYCLTLVGPIFHTIEGLFWGHKQWLWHIPACYASVLGAVWGYMTYLWAMINLSYNTYDLESDLQPK